MQKIDNRIRYSNFYGINILKFLLAIIIMGHHYYGCEAVGKFALKVPVYVEYLLVNGSMAVEIFFVISGFLIEYKYCDIIDKIAAFEFLEKRIKKLWLPTILFELLMFPIMINHPIDLWSILRAITFTETNWVESLEYGSWGGVTWYCFSLLFCYCVYWFVSQADSKMRGSIYAILSLAGWYLLTSDCINTIYILKSNARGICAFFFGILLYRLYKRFENSIKYILQFGWLSFIIFIVVAYFYGIDIVVGNLQMTTIYYFSSLFIMTGCYVSQFFINKNVQKISDFLGDISFYIFFETVSSFV